MSLSYASFSLLMYFRDDEEDTTGASMQGWGQVQYLYLVLVLGTSTLAGLLNIT